MAHRCLVYNAHHFVVLEGLFADRGGIGPRDEVLQLSRDQECWITYYIGTNSENMCTIYIYIQTDFEVRNS